MPTFSILKFSGRTVNTLEDWQNIENQIAECLHSGKTPVAVFSALQNVTNTLEELIDCACRKNVLLNTFSEEQLNKGIQSLKERHQNLAKLLLGSPGPDLWKTIFQELDRMLLGISLTQEAAPRLRARLMGLGERLTASLAQARLSKTFNDKKIILLEADKALHTIKNDKLSAQINYLEAAPDDLTPNLQLQQELSCGDIIITQGYIASNNYGEQVLLGRGGSDLSAAALSLKLQAEKVEFWSDLPGFYTADPHIIPSARLIRQLDYAEAQELASAGIPVVNPKAIALLAESQIPIYVRCSQKPELAGTCISSNYSDDNICVKALTSVDGLVLISLDHIGMWQQVGFLAQAFAIFANHGFSIDLVATSQSNVTVSLDKSTSSSRSSKLQELLSDLSSCCSPKLIAPCAALSLVGRKIRSNLHKLGPTLEIFEEEKVHLLSQAASDLNFTFVVDESQADRLLKTLHAQLFSGVQDTLLFGSSFRQDFIEAANIYKAQDRYKSTWWVQERSQLLNIAATPAYIYHQPTLISNAQTLLNLQAVDKVFFAVKANSNREVIKIFADQGLGFECVSVGELERIRTLLPDLSPDRLLFTPNFASQKEFEIGFKLSATITLDNLQPLQLWPETFKEKEVFLRLDLGHGAGHSRKVRTAGNFSKFGIPVNELNEAQRLTSNLNIKVIGLHSHSGSGIKTPETWAQSAMQLSECAQYFPKVKYLDLGGGLGVPEKRDLDTLDLNSLDKKLLSFKRNHPQYQIMIEPGRFLVAQAGVILTRVNQTKQKGDKFFIGCDAGMQTLIRPALYGAYHEIVNLSRWGQPKNQIADIVGPICETGDILGRDRRLTYTESGDILLIDTAGAYGFTMSSNYNLRPQPLEIVIF
ncbi:MAG: bifunctional aspartate kinase/diaminopimelate decarboxylase [Candidatus Bruticola sp.]